MTFEAFDVVVVPFPFTDRSTTKRRPALVLSDAKTFNRQVGQSVLAMITSARNSDWPPSPLSAGDHQLFGLGLLSVRSDRPPLS